VVHDALQGTFTQDVARDVGDFVVLRKDGVIPYQLAVVADDIEQRITEVVRGRDLLTSAPRQVLLFRALGHEPPAFAHVPLWVDAQGERLSKRRGDEPTLLRSFFARGETGARVLGRMGHALGVCAAEASLAPEELAALLDDAVLARGTITG
jgi:glutamyl-tRNA synthetase